MGLDVSSNRDYLAASCYDKTFKLWSLSDRKDLFLNCKEEELERPAIEVVKQYKEEHLEPTIPEKKLKTENAEVEMIVEESSTNDDIVEIADQPLTPLPLAPPIDLPCTSSAFPMSPILARQFIRPWR